MCSGESNVRESNVTAWQKESDGSFAYAPAFSPKPVSETRMKGTAANQQRSLTIVYFPGDFIAASQGVCSRNQNCRTPAGRTSRIRRGRAAKAGDRTDSLRAVPCLCYFGLLLLVI